MTDIARSRAVVRETSSTPHILRRGLAAIIRPIRGLDDFERLFYGGLILTAAGLAMVAPWLGFVVPGVSLSAVSLILKLRSR